MKMDYEFINSFKKPQVQNNWFLDLNPLSKLNIILILAIIPIVAKSWVVSVAVILVYFILATASSRIKQFSKVYIRLGLLIGSLLFIMRAMFIPGEDVLMKLGFLTITQEGVDHGIQFATLVVAICGALVFYSVATQAKDLMLALEKKGVPPTGTYVILSSLQSIIDLGSMSKLIMESQKARGIETEGKVINRIKAFFPILGPLFLGAISNSEEKAIAMDARAFYAPGKNTHLRELRPVPQTEKMILLIVNLAFIGFIVWRVVG
jgi:energy-coupling factor transport system permease protein